MRVIKRLPLKDFGNLYPRAVAPLEEWFRLTEKADWKNFAEVRRNFGQTDVAKVREGRAMSISTKNSRNSRVADSYLILIQERPLRAVRSRKDYDAAAKMIDRLALRDDLDEGEQQYLDAIEVLIEAYENNVMPVARDDRTPLERLKAAMRASNTTPVQLRSILGASQSMVSMILGGQREIKQKGDHQARRAFQARSGVFSVARHSAAACR